MFKRIFFAAYFISIALNGLTQQKRFSFTQPKMGSPFTIVLFSKDSVKANDIAKQCFKLVDSFNLIFSDYTDSSELGKLNAITGKNPQPFKLSPALYEILILAENAYEKSNGAFDITIGPLVKLWRKVRITKQFPTKTTVKIVQHLTGFNKLMIDSVGKKVTLGRLGMLLDLGGIAKGYIAQKIIDYLSFYQINNALVNAGGDIVMSGAPPGLKGWTIGVNMPETKDEIMSQSLIIQNKAVATSGDVYQFIENSGKRYSHIIDPKTGYGVTFKRNVTVIANDGATADWLATACSILPLKKAKRMANKLGAEVLIGEINKNKLILNETKGFALYWKQLEQ